MILSRGKKLGYVLNVNLKSYKTIKWITEEQGNYYTSY